MFCHPVIQDGVATGHEAHQKVSRTRASLSTSCWMEKPAANPLSMSDKDIPIKNRERYSGETGNRSAGLR